MIRATKARRHKEAMEKEKWKIENAKTTAVLDPLFPAFPFSILYSSSCPRVLVA